jgi:hypothetical protein
MKKENILFLIVLFILMFFLGYRLMASIRNKRSIKKALIPPPNPNKDKGSDGNEEDPNKWYYQADI